MGEWLLAIGALSSAQHIPTLKEIFHPHRKAKAEITAPCLDAAKRLAVESRTNPNWNEDEQPIVQTAGFDPAYGQYVVNVSFYVDMHETLRLELDADCKLVKLMSDGAWTHNP